MVNDDIVKGCNACACGDLCKFTWAVVLHTIDVVDDHVVNAVTLPGQRFSNAIQRVSDLHSCTHMTDREVANRDVRDLAAGAETPTGTVLVLGSQKDTKARLRKTTPSVFHSVAIDETALCVF